MAYTSLTKLYYQNEDVCQTEYQQRFNSPGSVRFGVIIQQYQRRNGYEAFLCYNNELIQLLQKIYTLKTELLLLKKELPEVVIQQYILQCITEEIKSTNDIEGVRSTRREIRAWLEKLPDTEKAPHLKSIIEKYSTISEGADIDFFSCRDIRRFYDEFALQEVLKDEPNNAPDGIIFRKGMVEIQGSAIGKIIHQGLYPETAVIEAMEKALQVLHDQELPMLLRIAVFHYLFAYIHPFYDGNGRMDRFISSYYLAKEFDATVALRLSVVIKRRKNNYYKHFQEADSEINRGDLTPFCIYFLGCVEEAFEDTLAALKHKQQQLIKYTAVLAKLRLTNKMLMLYNHLLEAALFYGMGLTIKQLMGITGFSRVTVQKLLDSISPEDIIVSKVTKPYRYKLNLLCLHRLLAE